MQKDDNLTARIEALEKRMSDEDLTQIINLRVDIVSKEKIVEIQKEIHILIGSLRKDLDS